MSDLIPAPTPPGGEFLFYQSDDGSIRLQVRLEDESVWLTQKLMAELFQKDVRTVNEHIQNIFEEGELAADSVIRKFRITAADGKNYETAHYNLDVINSVTRKPVAKLDLVDADAPGDGPGKPIAPINAPKSGENAPGISKLKGRPSHLSGQNDPINDLLIGIIREAPNADYGTLAQVLHVSEATVKRNLQKLKQQNLIRRVGSKKKGYWEIIE